MTLQWPTHPTIISEESTIVTSSIASSQSIMPMTTDEHDAFTTNLDQMMQHTPSSSSALLESQHAVSQPEEDETNAQEEVIPSPVSPPTSQRGVAYVDRGG